MVVLCYYICLRNYNPPRFLIGIKTLIKGRTYTIMSFSNLLTHSPGRDINPVPMPRRAILAGIESLCSCQDAELDVSVRRWQHIVKFFVYCRRVLDNL